MADLNDLNISTLLTLTPEEAVKLFESKGFTFTWDWREQLKLNHSQVFTVAKAMKMDILQDIRNMIGVSLKDGLDFKEFQNQLEPMLRARGWWGKQVVDGKVVQLGSPYRLQIIYDTNLQSSLNAGRLKEQKSNAQDRPFLEYVAILDPSTRPEHAALHGTIKPIDSPFWERYYPPLGFRCRCRTRDLTFKQMKKRGGITSGIPKTKDAIPVLKKRGISTKGLKKRPDFNKTVKATDGFGNPLKKWNPDRSKFDADIWKEGRKLKESPLKIKE